MNQFRNRTAAVLRALSALRYQYPAEILDIQTADSSYQLAEHFHTADHVWKAFGRNETWGGYDRHFWFRASVSAASGMIGMPLQLMLSTGASDIWNTDNPQIIAYLNGNMTATMDMNHQELRLTDSLCKEDVFELAFYAYSNTASESNFFHLAVFVPDDETAALYYDMKVLFDAADLLPDDSLSSIQAFDVLNRCINLLDLRDTDSAEFHDSILSARAFLKKEYYSTHTPSPVTVYSVGHTHIDVAWKWPLRQTREKAVRSFQTVLNLMKQYPDFRFMSSQPQLYRFVQEDAPWLFSGIKKRIAEGRWEADGGMWLEADCNLTAGESLVRQFLYGLQYMKTELQAPRNEVLWLPDVFGYSAALPQIMRQFGIHYFMTTKIGWNDTNAFPYDTFLWKVIDGSEVLTHLITTRSYDKHPEVTEGKSHSTTYNGMQTASQIMGTWQRYQNKNLSTDVLTCFGYGDGGGGPTAEMLEEDLRLHDGPADCPKTRQSSAKEFFHTLEKNMNTDYLPEWVGELYLEFHRGTYTSMAENKKSNRACEFLLQNAEFLSILSEDSLPYPKERLDACWKLLLLNQFHDILPGSAINEVYRESAEQYRTIRDTGNSIMREAAEAVCRRFKAGTAETPDAVCAFNTLGFSRTSTVLLDLPVFSASEMQETEDGRFLCLLRDVPAKGFMIRTAAEGISEKDCCLHSPDPSSTNHLSLQTGSSPVISSYEEDASGRPVKIITDYFEIGFDENGEISHLYDLAESRSVLQENLTGNQLLVYEDRPYEYDAWNIDPAYKEKCWHFAAPSVFRITENGSIRACIHLERHFLRSVLQQDIYFYRHTKRIDFKTRLDWHQHQLLLKAAFPMDLQTDHAVYDIQFGNVTRPTHQNTSWDQARFEVCAHKWADLSEAGYGAALLNDCRYGYDVHHSVLRLTLLKSGIDPNPDADQGIHEFTYALFLHQGDFRAGKVIQEAYDLNCPLYALPVRAAGNSAFSFFRIPEENVITETIKRSEDGNAVIIRAYEAYGKRCRIRLILSDGDWDAAETDLAEIKEIPLKRKGRICETEIRPYEIKTFKLTRQKITT